MGVQKEFQRPTDGLRLKCQARSCQGARIPTWNSRRIPHCLNQAVAALMCPLKIQAIQAILLYYCIRLSADAI